MNAKLENILKQEKRMVIDGSMGTALEDLGADLTNALWTASVLTKQPELIAKVHENYFKAGADCGITASYQATIPGLTAAGYTEAEAEGLIAKAVRIFNDARDAWWQAEGEAAGRAYPLCLASVGPYGAYLADGSEYKGHYGLTKDALRDFHRRRVELLAAEAPDLILFETVPSLTEALVEAEIAEDMGLDYWVSFSCKDDAHICEGDPIRDAAAAFAEGHPHLQMIGVNCTKPQYITGLIGEIKTACDLPIAVYPNSGEEYDAVTKTWHGVESDLTFYDHALSYYQAGAAAVGGCCTTVADHIRQVVQARADYLKGLKE